ncbi:molybdopterin-guanine dinucleotide biosynthesis protein MobA [Priestia megaterium]|uniref:Molybdopterin-guanine dinucleotide biosynthesis protein MobA n=1 Tax=Priestia megaterium TaxID=1404 RepID=A0A3D8WZV2_PRIMG|nr:MobQ family relaxase [Priestia megaterium]MDH3168688.1 MobQ family relaxase [Priestia megaterium]RDZ12880.1 molybdopterin-guanine dinucleotide biosynthesis protein MobA [Priestia megaterium]
MAIYHLSIQIISRSKGQSAVAAAAYRSCEKLHDERTDEQKFYARDVQPETMILTPTNAPEWMKDRNRLWNEVEKVEKRKDSQLARELNIALPIELNHDQQKELIQSFAQNEFVEKGMVADIAIHRDDANNPHAHIMLTMRNLDQNGFGKKNRDWNANFANTKENNLGYVKNSKSCLSIREQWANYANEALKKAQINERITHLSHEKRGLETLPTIHLGHVAHGMEKKGKQTDRGNINRDRQEYNQAVVDLQAYRRQKEEHLKKMKEKEKQFSFSTDKEKTDIQKAASLLDKKFITLKDITERQEQLRKMGNRHDPIERHFHAETQQFMNVSTYYTRIDDLEREIKQNEQKVEEVKKDLNPFKLKENNMIKRRHLDRISDLESNKENYQNSIQTNKRILRFSNKEEFDERFREFLHKKLNRLNQIDYEKKQIQVETKVLLQAEKAIKTAKIREISSHYPDLKTSGQYLTYENALKLEKHIELAQKTPLTLPVIEKSIKNAQNKLHKLEKDMKIIQVEKDHLGTMSKQVKQLEEAEKKIDELSNHPGEMAKRLVSRKVRQHFEELQSEASYCRDSLKQMGYKGTEDLEQRQSRIEEIEEKTVPSIEKEIKAQKTGLEGLTTIFYAIQQATRSEEFTQQRHQLRRMKSTNINRSKNQGPDLSR